MNLKSSSQVEAASRRSKRDCKNRKSYVTDSQRECRKNLKNLQEISRLQQELLVVMQLKFEGLASKKRLRRKVFSKENYKIKCKRNVCTRIKVTLAEKEFVEEKIEKAKRTKVGYFREMLFNGRVLTFDFFDFTEHERQVNPINSKLKQLQ